jgi:hypothetical protein
VHLHLKQTLFKNRLKSSFGPILQTLNSSSPILFSAI